MFEDDHLEMDYEDRVSGPFSDEPVQEIEHDVDDPFDGIDEGFAQEQALFGPLDGWDEGDELDDRTDDPEVAA